MTSLFHPARRLSIGLCGAALAAAMIFALGTGSANAGEASASGGSAYYGRWVVDDTEARFSTRGLEYKTIDIAPCGKDFCGVSVNDAGKCGKTLFRFLSKNKNADMLKGHGKWGSARKNVVIYNWDDGGTPPNRTMQLYLGDGYDFGDRGGSMPMYESQYRRSGVARCSAR